MQYRLFCCDIPDCRIRWTVWWTRTWDGGTRIRKSTLQKRPRSKLWLPESAIAHTCDKRLRATLSWGGCIWKSSLSRSATDWKSISIFRPIKHYNQIKAESKGSPGPDSGTMAAASWEWMYSVRCPWKGWTTRSFRLRWYRTSCLSMLSPVATFNLKLTKQAHATVQKSEKYLLKNVTLLFNKVTLHWSKVTVKTYTLLQKCLFQMLLCWTFWTLLNNVLLFSKKY